MNKKSQFYIFIALVLIALVLSGAQFLRVTERPSTTFKELHENYLREGAAAANRGQLQDFTERFVEYARTRDPEFGLMYIFVDEDIKVYNGLKKSININTNLSLMPDEAVTFDFVEDVAVFYEEEVYYFNLSSTKQLQALFISDAGENIKVHVTQ